MRPAGRHRIWLREHRGFHLSRRAVRTLALAVVVPVVLLGHVRGAEAIAAGGPNPTLVNSVQSSTSLSGAGYVAVSGTYAYVAAFYQDALAVVDISNPALPQVVGQSDSSPCLLNASHLTIVGTYAYVVSQNRNLAPANPSTGYPGNNDDGTGNCLTILDISNQTAPTIVGTFHDPNVMFGPHGVAVAGSYAFIAAQGCLTLNKEPCPNSPVLQDASSFIVVDVSDPSHPTLVASVADENLPAPWTGSKALQHACGITVFGNYAYVTASYSNRLTIVDISDPLHPSIVGSVQDATNLPRPVDVAYKNGFAYVANQSLNGNVTAVDVRNPTAPQVVGTYGKSGLLNGAYRIRVRKNFAYVAAVTANATVAIDISDPAHPRLAGPYVDTARLNHSAGVDLDQTSRYAISTSGYLSTDFPNNIRPIYPPFPGQPGGKTATGTVSVISLDPNPISVSIPPTSGPGSSTSATTATFSFSTNDLVSTVRCSLDGAPFSLCTTPTSQQYGGLAPGPHTFQVQAIDAADQSATASYSWTITVPNYLPPTSKILDPFNRTDGVVGTSWTPIKTGFASMNVSANRAVDSSPSVYAWNFWNGSSPGPDAEAYATIANYAGGTIGIGARVTAGGSYSGYFVSIDPSGVWSINRIDNGGAPSPPLGGPGNVASQPLASGDKIAIRVAGSVVTALHYTSSGGWTQVLRYNTSQDSVRYTSAGRLAIYFLNGAIDDFGGGTLVAPANTGLPSVSGTVAVGQQLTATTGTWSGTPTPTSYPFTYQWQDCDSGGNNCNPILDATASTYTIQPSDGGQTVRVVVTASNTAGSAQAASAVTSVVPQAPMNTQLPSVSGTVAVGQQLQADPGQWSGTPAPTFTYQWLDCDSTATDCSPISGATASSYTIQGADVGFALDVVVTGSNSAGSSGAASAPTTVVPQPPQPPANTKAPQITGTAAVGQQVEADSGTWTGTPAPTFSYQWQDCDSSGNNCVAIPDATGSGYTVQGSDVGFTLEVVVTGSNSAGSSQAVSAPTTVVPQPSQPPVNTVPPSVSGTVAVGQQLQADSGTWTGTPAPTFSYQWQDCDSSGNNCVAIAGATASGYTIQTSDGGFTLEVVVTGSNSAGNSQAASAPTAAVTKPPTTGVLDNFNNRASIGSKWSVIKSSGYSLMTVSANMAVNSVTSGTYAWDYWNATTFGPDVEAYVTVASYPSAPGTIRIGARVTPGSSYSGYFVQIDKNGVWSIIRVDNPVTQFKLGDTANQPLASGDKIGIRVVGSVVTALHYTASAGWQQVLSWDTSIDRVRYTGAGSIAIEFLNGALDDFGGGSI